MILAYLHSNSWEGTLKTICVGKCFHLVGPVIVGWGKANPQKWQRTFMILYILLNGCKSLIEDDYSIEFCGLNLLLTKAHAGEIPTVPRSAFTASMRDTLQHVQSLPSKG